MLLASIICWLVYLLVAFLDWVAEREKGGGGLCYGLWHVT